MAFKRKLAADVEPEDPEHLYRQLALQNNGPEALWAHQADVLRSWHGTHADSPDVAIELPTGAGKTLVGGLIGEYRRRTSRDRVVYLCPTRLLARQTAEKLTEYGIANVLLIGKVNSWSMGDRARYTSSDAIAVSVYSHVFNVNPALDDAQMLLLDDAHAAESYVAGPWSLQINRRTHKGAYLDVLSVLADALDPIVLARLRSDSPSGRYRNDVYLASPLAVAAKTATLDQVLADASDGSKIADDAKYALRFLQSHLDRCLIYVTYRRILIRPLIPPTMTHQAFDHPTRRVYMSATLGSGGELERIFGRRRIARIPIPKGWEKQGTGRRFFCFPELTKDLSNNGVATRRWVADFIANHGRAIVLTPDRRTSVAFVEKFLPDECEPLSAADVEDDLTEFTDQEAAALVLNNRYDGIDLPDDDCRLVVLARLPARGDLQERFLHGSLGAVEVLQERIRARIMQGSGRATRNARDYAVVLVLGDDLVSYVTRRDIQDAMHPEIHAELEFGYQQSIGISSDEMLEQIAIFIAHDSEWREVDGDIVAARDQYERTETPGTAQLQESAVHEIDAYAATWQGEWSRALQLIRRVIDALSGGRASQRYAALWNYLAFCVARRLAAETQDTALADVATKYYEAARAAGRGTMWLSHLDSPVERAVSPPLPEVDPIDEQAMQGVLDNAQRLAKPSAFDALISEMRSALEATTSKPYEAALVTLGKLAGANPSSGNGNKTAAPDATWIFGRTLWVCWEAKTEADPDGELGAETVRQAGSHIRYVEASREESAAGDSPVFVVAPQQRIHSSAHAIAERHVYLIGPSQVLNLFDRLVRAWRAARSRDVASLSTTELAAIFHDEDALPSQWLVSLRTDPLSRRGNESPQLALEIDEDTENTPS